MKKRVIIKAYNVMPFSSPGRENISESRALINKESVGSEKLYMAQYTLRAGKKNRPGVHPCPYDETYYILKGRAILSLNDKKYEIGPDTAVFIPCGTTHQLENIGDEDLVLIAHSPLQYIEGINPLYDQREKTWGKTFRLINEEGTPKDNN